MTTAAQTKDKAQTSNQETALFKVEFTDTYGGEANYCWIERYLIRATSIKQAIRKAKQARYRSPVPRHKVIYCSTYDARIDIIGACVCLFADLISDEYADEYRAQYAESIRSTFFEID